MSVRKIAAAAIVGIAVLIAVFVVLRMRPPVANPDVAETTVDQPIIIAPLENDSDPNGTPLAVVKVETSGQGTATIRSDNKIEYLPPRLFFGAASLRYTIQNRRGYLASSEITVKVKYVPPKFAERDGRISLSEMMQQPPTNLYGSSINIYAYQDDSGHIREISVAGHADSRTCEHTSGLILGTLLTKRAGAEEFILAAPGD